MPKNKGKGGRNKRKGKKENEYKNRDLVFKQDGQEYAQVTKMLGNARLEAVCSDGVTRICHIRGSLRNKVWINTSDIILVGLRDYQWNLVTQIPLILKMMMKSSLRTLQLRMKTLRYLIELRRLRIMLQLEFWSSPAKKKKN
ncbi:eukaryotic translation initiation factor 1A, Y-chromosomal-like isoform X2 [Cervus canadensis]|uniref:eukaryotic translation initiation factor 1A, Y-chromosomal-like isoform X2 n=1 Tax=Cervus canadensis TaxID=1574408 RepID=UPI001CA31F7E|nr:eukaryotic translation initiation factor 1A, Y-chromosomal-like isoform X2 [Cervus canadensis]XP_043316153.1 eukaryotic translation initiation factor 1A, Y-chromosomal-like isoform X2 [Cervus canadensis]